jgi:hypothetical protein
MALQQHTPSTIYVTQQHQRAPNTRRDLSQRNKYGGGRISYQQPTYTLQQLANGSIAVSSPTPNKYYES